MKIHEGVHQMRISFNVTPEISRYVHVYILEGKKGCYLIDAGVKGGDKKIGEYIHKFGKNRENINAVLLTHSHPDHIGALKSIKNTYSCSVYASRGERDWIEDIDLQYEKRPIPGYYSLVDGSVPVDRVLSDGDLLELEPGITIQVIGAPGHSRDSLCFYYREHKILFTGDAIPEPTDALIYEDSLASETTLKRLEELKDVELYCPAWDKVYDSSTGKSVIHDGLLRISKIRERTEAHRGQMQEGSHQELFELICEESNLTEYKKNPLFMRSVMSDLSR